jgi:hypothetical protein
MCEACQGNPSALTFLDALGFLAWTKRHRGDAEYQRLSKSTGHHLAILGLIAYRRWETRTVIWFPHPQSALVQVTRIRHPPDDPISRLEMLAAVYACPGAEARHVRKIEAPAWLCAAIQSAGY